MSESVENTFQIPTAWNIAKFDIQTNTKYEMFRWHLASENSCQNIKVITI